MKQSFKIFMTVAEELSIVKAAKRSFVTQQCVSDHIKRLEEEYGILVYHAYFYHASYGDILDCLYISSDPDCFEDTLEDSKDEIASIYAFNLTEPMFSEFGSGAYRPCNGGISKTA